MTPEVLRDLLHAVSSGRVAPETALEQLKHVSFETLGFAHVDHHRQLRQGFAEVIYGAGKTTSQIVAIAERMLAAGHNVVCTRTDSATAEALMQIDARTLWHASARVASIMLQPPRELGRVGVLCAGTSDLPVADEAAVCARLLGAQVTQISDVGVAGIQRVLSYADTLSTFDAVIVVAGMDGALPSVVGGLVAAPVVAVPTSVGYGASFGGVAALLTMLNACAAGITVVNIDNGFGAAAAVMRILRRA